MPEPTEDEILEEANRLFDEKWGGYHHPELSEMNNRCQGYYKGKARRNLVFQKIEHIKTE